jgi:hypothetical protein
MPYQNIILYGVIYAFVLTATVLYFNITSIKKGFSMDTLIYMIMILFPFCLALFYIYPAIKNKGVSISMMAAGLIFMVVIIGVSYFYSVLPLSLLRQFKYFFLILGATTLIISLAVFFYLFGNYFKHQRGLLGFIINFIFFIPCLLLDFIEWVKQELALTTRTIYILILIEIIVLFVFLKLPGILNDYLYGNTVYLLKDGEFLNKQKVIFRETSSLAMEEPENLILSSSAPKFRNNFALSMWIYVNAQTDNHNSQVEMPIFNYGLGKPKISYLKDNADVDKYIIHVADETIEHTFTATLSSQKWNYFVFNYNANVVDLFINGALAKTFSLNAVPQYNTDDTITVGSTNGVKGAICNIVYYKSSLTNDQIVNSYNILMNKNPPVNKL